MSEIGIERSAPLVVAIVNGGLVQEDYRCAGTGVPEFVVLDFDREGEDEEERRDWCDWADAVALELLARNKDVKHLFRDIEISRPR